MTSQELNEFKIILEDRKAQILKNVQNSEKGIEELKVAHASDEADYATISTDSEIERTLSAKLMQELKEIEYSLFKIKDKTYGICEMCEEPIGIARLKVKPQARYCIVCREIVEKSA